MTTPLVRSTMKWMAEGDIDIASYHWFDITGLPDKTMVQQNWLLEYRPPFEKCMVCWQSFSQKDLKNYNLITMIEGSDPNEGIMVTVFRGELGAEPVVSMPLVYFIEDGFVRYGAVDENVVMKEIDGEMTLGFIAGWYRSLSMGCNTYVASIPQTFTNKRKIAQGKLPTYEWRTVVIEPTKPKSESKGGTHASPKLHDRRGHLRRLQSGKNVWVRSCKVGDASKGVIFHDYKIGEVA
jgi:hypothetical protein